MSAPDNSTTPENSASTSSVIRKRLTAGSVVVLCLLAGTVVGDRFIPFRGTGVSANCGEILSAVDMDFLQQTTLTGRKITSTQFVESGEGDGYRLDCAIYGNKELQLDARVSVTEASVEAWQSDLKDRGRLPGEVKPLRLTANDEQEGTGLSADSSAALNLPCKLPGDGTVRLSISVKAPGASDGNADDQRLTIAAIASRIAAHSILEVRCMQPVTVPDRSPSFAS